MKKKFWIISIISLVIIFFCAFLQAFSLNSVNKEISNMEKENEILQKEIQDLENYQNLNKEK